MGTEFLDRLSKFDSKSIDNDDLNKQIRKFKQILEDIRGRVPQAYEDPGAHQILVSIAPVL